MSASGNKPKQGKFHVTFQYTEIVVNIHSKHGLWVFRLATGVCLRLKVSSRKLLHSCCASAHYYPPTGRHLAGHLHVFPPPASSPPMSTALVDVLLTNGCKVYLDWDHTPAGWHAAWYSKAYRGVNILPSPIACLSPFFPPPSAICAQAKAETRLSRVCVRQNQWSPHLLHPYAPCFIFINTCFDKGNESFYLIRYLVELVQSNFNYISTQWALHSHTANTW